MMTEAARPPRVLFRLPRVDSPAGNAYAILGSWETAARRAGWTREQIKATITDATSGDYYHLRDVLAQTAEARA